MKKCPLVKVLTIAKVAFKKLPIVAVLPLDCVTILDTSELEKHLDTGAATMRQRDMQDKRASCCATVPPSWGRGEWQVLEVLHKHALFT